MAAQRHRLQLAIKRAVDVVVAAVALLLLSPLMAVIAASILLTMGPPVLFRHRRLGLVLRALTLDELPELVNVLRGDLSLVGPRPLLPEYRELYTSEQWRRHEMPPGMAGPALAAGRNALSWDDKFAADVAYVDDWSLWLDAKVLALSVWRVLRREGVSAEGHATMPRFEGPRE